MILQGGSCIQRNMRILGTLSNLYLQKDRSFRLKDLTTILDNLIFAIPSEFQANFKTILKKMSHQEMTKDVKRS